MMLPSGGAFIPSAAIYDVDFCDCYNSREKTRLSSGSLVHAAMPLIIFLSIVLAGTAIGVENPGEVPAQAGVDEKVGQQVDLRLRFVDNQGREGSLGQFFVPGRPMILIPAYILFAKRSYAVYR